MPDETRRWRLYLVTPAHFDPSAFAHFLTEARRLVGTERMVGVTWPRGRRGFGRGFGGRVGPS